MLSYYEWLKLKGGVARTIVQTCNASLGNKWAKQWSMKRDKLLEHPRKSVASKRAARNKFHPNRQRPTHCIWKYPRHTYIFVVFVWNDCQLWRIQLGDTQTAPTSCESLIWKINCIRWNYLHIHYRLLM